MLQRRHDSRMRLRISTWNIGGGFAKGKNSDYEANLAYFAQSLGRVGAEMVCIQEAHANMNGSQSQIEELAVACAARNWLSVPISPSHLKQGLRLAIGFITQFEIIGYSYHPLSNPELTATGPDGTEWRTFDKGYIWARLQCGKHELRVITGHSYPFHYFGRSAAENEFSQIGRELDSLILRSVKEGPTIVAGDMNFGCPELILPALKGDNFTAALPAKPTVPDSRRWDHIYASHHFEVLRGDVIEGQADHYVCWADLLSVA